MREFKSFDRQVSLPYLTEAINNVAMEAVIAPNRPGLDHEIRVNLRSSQFSTPGALWGRAVNCMKPSANGSRIYTVVNIWRNFYPLRKVTDNTLMREFLAA